MIGQIKIGGINCLTFDEVARQMHANRQTIARMVKRGDLRAVRMGRFKYIPFCSLQDYIKGSNKHNKKQR